MADTADIPLDGLPDEATEEAFRRTRLALLDLLDRVGALETKVAALEAAGQEGG